MNKFQPQLPTDDSFHRCPFILRITNGGSSDFLLRVSNGKTCNVVVRFTHSKTGKYFYDISNLLEVFSSKWPEFNLRSLYLIYDQTTGHLIIRIPKCVPSDLILWVIHRGLRRPGDCSCEHKCSHRVWWSRQWLCRPQHRYGCTIYNLYPSLLCLMLLIY